MPAKYMRPARVVLLVAALALPCIGCTSTVEKEDEQAVKVLEDKGAKVGRDENQLGNPATTVEFAKADDGDLKLLTSLKRLRSLDLTGSSVSDAGLKELVQLERLAVLNLTGTRVTDAGLKEIATLKNLTQLVITGTSTSNAGVADLQKALPYCNIQR
jgi:hypothetical protein